MKDLTIIIPLKEYNESVDESLNRAIKSCQGNPIILIGKDVSNFKTKKKDNIKTVENEDSTYQKNVNIAVDQVETKYFSVLEYDDYFSGTWFNNVEKYINVDVENISGYLPLTEVVDFDKNQVIGYANEAYWASSFSEKIGYMDLLSAQDYLNFNTSGAVFKTEDFIAVGKLKESMKLVFWYEFLLRALHENKLLFVIPKIGYYHFIGRKGSLTDTYSNELDEKEADWWIDLAKKEYFFKRDRNKQYKE